MLLIVGVEIEGECSFARISQSLPPPHSPWESKMNYSLLSSLLAFFNSETNYFRFSTSGERERVCLSEREWETERGEKKLKDNPSQNEFHMEIPVKDGAKKNPNWSYLLSWTLHIIWQNYTMKYLPNTYYIHCAAASLFKIKKFISDWTWHTYCVSIKNTYVILESN